MSVFRQVSVFIGQIMYKHSSGRYSPNRKADTRNYSASSRVIRFFCFPKENQYREKSFLFCSESKQYRIEGFFRYRMSGLVERAGVSCGRHCGREPENPSLTKT